MDEVKTGVFKIKNNIPIFIIGDIHGDYQCLIHCMVDLCNVASIVSIKNDAKYNEPQREILEWNGNNSIVIFCGDLIHRKRFMDSVLDDECSDIFIIKTLIKLKKSAKKFGGDIIIISGNHEIMNIIDPNDTTYISDKNLQQNKKYFSQTKFIDNYINNTYAWVKINDIMIAHGGLCSDYLNFLDEKNELNKKKNINSIKNVLEGGLGILYEHNVMIGGNLYEFGDDVVEFINDTYRSFFINYSSTKSKSDSIGYKLFVKYDYANKHTHNLFWCREWGYSGINCDDFDKVIKKIGCDKMIVAHCPQFLSEDKSKMINFECIDTKDKIKTNITKYKIARVDLGMSRSFEYNKSDEFIKFLSYNHNRKMSILKLSWDDHNNNYYFNYDSIITKKISCIQYLLIKYGITLQDWNNKNIHSNWLGFKYIDSLINVISNKKEFHEKYNESFDSDNPIDVMLCLLYPIYFNEQNLKSINQFNNLIHTQKNLK